MMIFILLALDDVTSRVSQRKIKYTTTHNSAYVQEITTAPEPLSPRMPSPSPSLPLLSLFPWLLVSSVVSDSLLMKRTIKVTTITMVTQIPITEIHREALPQFLAPWKRRSDALCREIPGNSMVSSCQSCQP